MLAPGKSNGWAKCLPMPKLSTNISKQCHLQITGIEIKQLLKRYNLYQESDRGGKALILLTVLIRAVKCKCCAHTCLPSAGPGSSQAGCMGNQIFTLWMIWKQYSGSSGSWCVLPPRWCLQISTFLEWTFEVKIIQRVCAEKQTILK